MRLGANRPLRGIVPLSQDCSEIPSLPPLESTWIQPSVIPTRPRRRDSVPIVAILLLIAACITGIAFARDIARWLT